ncbi:MAG: CehA/McbA family metallohydrolase [Candidatus Micrarchaeaceae archaeon]
MMIINLDGKLLPRDSKTIKWETFEVSQNVSNIKIKFDYMPHISEFENHVNLLIYDSMNQFMGRYDRGYENVVVGLDASPAAKKILPLPGTWKLALENHQLFSDISYHIEVEIQTNDKFTYKWHTGELHTHSIHSDGKLTVKELNDFMRSNYFDFFFLTDHSNNTGWQDFEDLGERNIILPGEELNTFKGHILILGNHDFIDWKDITGQVKSPQSIQNEVRISGGLMGIAHPFWIGDPICVGCSWKYNETPFDFDFVEIWNGGNGRRNIESLNLRAIYGWLSALRQGKKVVATSGRDFHDKSGSNWWMKSHFLSRNTNLSEILYAIKNGMIYMSHEQLRGNFDPAPGTEVKSNENQIFNFQVSGYTGGQSFVITKKTVVSLGETSSGEVNLKDLEENDFAVFMMSDKTGIPLIITNPVYFKKGNENYSKIVGHNT